MADQVLSRTLNQKFDTVFEEVTHQETLNLLNRNDLKLFCLDIETNQFNYDPLVEFLEDNLGMYVFSRAELDELVDAGKDCPNLWHQNLLLGRRSSRITISH